jgi:hypothetical protein
MVESWTSSISSAVTDATRAASDSRRRIWPSGLTKKQSLSVNHASANRCAAALKNTTPESAVIQKLVGLSV